MGYSLNYPVETNAIKRFLITERDKSGKGMGERSE